MLAHLHRAETKTTSGQCERGTVDEKAVERMEHSDLGELLARLELTLDIFDHFET